MKRLYIVVKELKEPTSGRSDLVAKLGNMYSKLAKDIRAKFPEIEIISDDSLSLTISIPAEVSETVSEEISQIFDCAVAESDEPDQPGKPIGI